MSNKPENSRFVDMGGGNIAELISHQIQVFWDPTNQAARAVFNGAPYMLMGRKYQRIGMEQDVLEQELTHLMHLRMIPAGTLDPVTGVDLGQVSMAGIVTIHKGAYDFFHNVRAGTPGYPLQSTITGATPTYQGESRPSVPLEL